MKKYKVTFTETTELETIIEADSEQEAEEKMEKMIETHEIDLIDAVPVESYTTAKEIRTKEDFKKNKQTRKSHEPSAKVSGLKNL